MIRLIFAAIYAFLSVVLLYPYHIYLWLLSKKDQQKGWNKSWKIVRSFFKGVLNIAGYYDNLLNLFSSMEAGKFIGEKDADYLIVSPSPRELVDRVLDYFTIS